MRQRMVLKVAFAWENNFIQAEFLLQNKNIDDLFESNFIISY